MSKSIKNIHELDGIRGIASLAVILSHSFLMFIPSLHTGADFTSLWQSAMFNSPVSFFYKGNGAVSVFFVLSGIVLSLSCVRNNTSEYIRTSALKRYVRLGIPVGAAVLLCYFMMVLGVFPAARLGVNQIPLAGAFLFEPSLFSALYDASFGAMMFSGVQYNYVLWTISLEFFGSLFVYSIVALFGGNVKTLRLAALIATLYLMSRENIYSVFYGLFSAGVFISTFRINYSSTITSKIAATSSLIVGLYLIGYAPNSSSYSWVVNEFWDIQQSYGLKIQWPVFAVSLGSLFVVATVFIDYSILSILTISVFRHLGRLSYSIYLLHPMILAIVGPLIYKYIAKYSFGAVYTFILTTLFAIVFSIPFYRYIDRSSIRIASYISGEAKRKATRSLAHAPE